VIRSIRLRRTVAGLLVSSLLVTFACQGDDAPDIVEAPGPAPSPDIVDDDGTAKGYMYYAGNAYHANRMEPLLARPDVAAMISAFTAGGYELSSENSFTVEGTDGETVVSATFVGMIGSGAKSDRSLTIVCYESGGEFGISPVVFSTSPAKNEVGWRQISDDAWYRTLSAGDNIGLSEQRVDWSTWDEFWDCMMTRMPGAAIGCAVGCVLIPGFAQCVFVCVAGQSLSTTVGCLITAILTGGKKAKN
jgi:hypothetical protein